MITKSFMANELARRAAMLRKRPTRFHQVQIATGCSFKCLLLKSACARQLVSRRWSQLMSKSTPLRDWNTWAGVPRRLGPFRHWSSATLLEWLCRCPKGVIIGTRPCVHRVAALGAVEMSRALHPFLDRHIGQSAPIADE